MKTVSEVAEIFRVNERTVQNWIASGEMKAIKLGKTIRITDEEIERLKKGE